MGSSVLRRDYQSPVLDRRLALARRAQEILFGAFILLILASPSFTRGPFNWLPVVRLDGIEETPVGIGPLVLLPGLALVTWLLVRMVEGPRRPWDWGRPGITLPLAGLTLLMLLGLDPVLNQRTMVVLMTVGLVWWVYLFVVNEAPHLVLPLSLVIVIQGSVAVAQFALQQDLGLSAVGEQTLDPQLSGVSVLFARGERWLRAYGLTGHPNLLGAMLAVLLLLLLDDIAGARRWRRGWLAVVASAGVLGLLTTFSRGAWLAGGVGLVCWMARRVIAGRDRAEWTGWLSSRRFLRNWREYVQFIAPAVLALVFLVLFHDLVASRFLHLETPIEATSIEHREVDAKLALRLIAEHPWTGVGVQHYLVAVRAIEPNSRTVHNVLLLTAAELGLPGAGLWLWLSLVGLLSPLSAAWAPWVTMVISGLFDVALAPTNSWCAASLFALLAAHTAFPGGAAEQAEGTDDGGQ